MAFDRSKAQPHCLNSKGFCLPSQLDTHQPIFVMSQKAPPTPTIAEREYRVTMRERSLETAKIIIAIIFVFQLLLAVNLWLRYSNC